MAKMLPPIADDDDILKEFLDLTPEQKQALKHLKAQERKVRQTMQIDRHRRNEILLDLARKPLLFADGETLKRVVEEAFKNEIENKPRLVNNAREATQTAKRLVDVIGRPHLRAAKRSVGR